MADLTKAELAGRTQDHLNKYILGADQKASILLTGQFAFLGLAATAAKDLIKTTGELFYWSSIGVGVAGIVAAFFAIVVIYPRTPSTGEGFIFWGNILAHGSVEDFQEAFDNLSESDINERFVTQNHMLAKVANKKYKYLRWSLRVTLLMIILATFAGSVYVSQV